MPVFLEKFHIILALFAGLVVLIFAIFLNATLMQMLQGLVATLIIFYIGGLIVRFLIKKQLLADNEINTALDDNENDEENIL